jgi:hypothetical protein
VRYLSRHLIALALIGTAECASGGSSAPAADRVEPPQMISREPAPQLDIPPMPTSGRSPVRVSIEVMIDETGRPVMSTFKISGIGAPENEGALRRWIEQATFRPARHGTTAVPGVFKAALQVQIRRIS